MFIRPSLLAHEFARLDQPGIPEHLIDSWRDLAAALHMRVDVDVAVLPVPDGGSTDDLTVSGRAKRPTDGADLYEAVLATTVDASCRTVLLAPNDQARTWAALDAELTRAQPATVGAEVLGSARVYVGLVDAPPGEERVEAIGAALGREIPDARDGAWTRRWSRTAQGFLLWEAPTTRPGQRRLVLIGSRLVEPELDAFAWTPGGGELGPFVRYLLDAAKLRYQQAVHQASGGGIRRLGLSLDESVDRLLELHRSASSTPAQLVRADAGLTELQAGSAGVITTLARLRAVALSIDAVEANLRAAVPVERVAPGPPGPLAVDLALVRTTRDRVADDIARLEISRDRAERVSALTAIAVHRGLTANQQQLLLVQASVISSILMILAAVQALGADLRIPRSLHLPAITFLGSLAFVLPTAVLRWSRLVPRDLPLRTVDYAAVCLTGMSTGWLGGEIVSHLTTGRVLEAGWTWAAVIGGGVVAGCVGWLRARRLGRLRRVPPA